MRVRPPGMCRLLEPKAMSQIDPHFHPERAAWEKLCRGWCRPVSLAPWQHAPEVQIDKEHALRLQIAERRWRPVLRTLRRFATWPVDHVLNTRAMMLCVYADYCFQNPVPERVRDAARQLPIDNALAIETFRGKVASSSVEANDMAYALMLGRRAYGYPEVVVDVMIEHALATDNRTHDRDRYLYAIGWSTGGHASAKELVEDLHARGEDAASLIYLLVGLGHLPDKEYYGLLSQAFGIELEVGKNPFELFDLDPQLARAFPSDLRLEREPEFFLTRKSVEVAYRRMTRGVPVSEKLRWAYRELCDDAKRLSYMRALRILEIRDECRLATGRLLGW